MKRSILKQVTQDVLSGRVMGDMIWIMGYELLVIYFHLGK
jgi:hypothetical protein